MIRSRAFLLVLCGGVLVGSRAPAVLRRADQGPAYSVAAVLDHLARDPHAWVGRTILVHGRPILCLPIPSGDDRSCTSLMPGTAELRDADPSPRGTPAALSLTQEGSDPLLAQVHRLPLLGELLPAPQMVIWGVVGTYRVQLLPMLDSRCVAGTCYVVSVIDASP